jgi:uncharacterized membrane protein
MNKLVNAGRAMFAAGIFLLGLLCIVYNDFIAGRPPAWPAAFNPNPLLAYFSGPLVMLAALGILLRVRPRTAALAIALLLLCFSVFRHLPHFTADWVNAYKSIALLGGALLVAGSYNYFPVAGEPYHPLHQGSARFFIIAGSTALAVFFIACGYAHFRYADFVTGIIPSYIPYRVFWTYFSGTCLLLGGLGLLLRRTRKTAAFWSGIMITGWFFLLHIPRLAADPQNASDRMGVAESLAIAGICFCLSGLSGGDSDSIE